jgi:hypothetical protein
MYASQSFTAHSSSLIANSCDITGNGNIIAGHSNNIRGNNNKVTGHSNSIHGDSNLVTGNSNSLYGRNNQAYGISNRSTVIEPSLISAPVPVPAAAPVLLQPHQLIARESLLSKRFEVLQSVIKRDTVTTANLTVEQVVLILQPFAGRVDKLLDAWRYVLVFCKWFNTHMSLKGVTRLLEVFTTFKSRVDAFSSLWVPYVNAFGTNPAVSLAFVTRTLAAIPDLGQQRRLLRLVLVQHPCDSLTSSTFQHVALFAHWFRQHPDIVQEWLCDHIQAHIEELSLDCASEALAHLLVGCSDSPTDWLDILDAWLPGQAKDTRVCCWPYAIIIQDVLETLQTLHDAMIPPQVLTDVTKRLDTFCQSDQPPVQDRDIGAAAAAAAADVQPPDAKRQRIDEPAKPSDDLLASVIDEHPAADEQPDATMCVVCLERVKKIVLLPCRHYCLCGACARAQQASVEPSLCPVCRAPITSLLPIF